MSVGNRVREARHDAERAVRDGPRATGVEYHFATHTIVVHLAEQDSLRIAVRRLQGLDVATVDQVRDVRVTAEGSRLRWDALDADFTIAGLARGVYLAA